MAYTTQQLAERFIDQREIQNVMGKYALLTMICKQADLVDKFWSKRAETPTLARNDGWYVGLEAISGYYQAISDNLAAKLPLMRKLFPKELGNKSDEDIFGVGEHFPRPITTPIVEVAADGKTAKGLWQVMGANNSITQFGPFSTWSWGYIAADFVLEDDEWKIWHLQEFDELTAPVATSWVKDNPYPVLDAFAELADQTLPAPTVPARLYEVYSPEREYTAPPRMPEPYETFADTFSYGMNGKEAI
ncbi:MAG: nuclear transport factor 2 family protein [Oscillospiraceae bacterium]|nr:nuclear transport factor 2 family protein [Oscillospiraceae bacterium]